MPRRQLGSEAEFSGAKDRFVHVCLPGSASAGVCTRRDVHLPGHGPRGLELCCSHSNNSRPLWRSGLLKLRGGLGEDEKPEVRGEMKGGTPGLLPGGEIVGTGLVQDPEEREWASAVRLRWGQAACRLASPGTLSLLRGRTHCGLGRPGTALGRPRPPGRGSCPRSRRRERAVGGRGGRRAPIRERDTLGQFPSPSRSSLVCRGFYYNRRLRFYVTFRKVAMLTFRLFVFCIHTSAFLPF